MTPPLPPQQPHAPDRARAAAWVLPLAATIALQTTSAFLGRLVPTIAPLLTASTGLGEESVGYMTALSTLGSIVFLAAGHPLIRRFGPIRTLQAGVLFSGLGLALLGTPHWIPVLLANFILGLGYGPSAPAGSDILLRHAPPRHRTLIFSIKQAGVPAGGVIAGLVLPWLVDRMDWHVALVVVACMPLLTVLAVQPVRNAVDVDRNPDQPIDWRTLSSPANLLAPLRLAMASPVLRRLTLCGCSFSIGQGTVIAFTVTYLVERLGYDLVAAGLVFAVLQSTGIFGRVALGWISDRWGSGLRTLRVNAIAMAATVTGFALIGPDTPYGVILTLSAVAGVTVTSWNGVQLAEIARLSPPGRISESTAGASLVTFLGYVVGPTGFAALLALTGSYAICFSVVAVLALASFAGLWSLREPLIPPKAPAPSNGG